MTQFLTVEFTISSFFTLLIWIFVPDFFSALFSDYLTTKVVKAINTFPYSRKLEIEADEVGTLLAARACYDVRQFEKFFLKKKDDVIFSVPVKQKDKDGKVVVNEEVIRFKSLFATHPPNVERSEALKTNLPKVSELSNKLSIPES